MSVAGEGPERGSRTDAETLLAKARQNGFWGGILASVIATVIGAGLTAIFPALWDFVWTPRLPSGAVVAFDRLELNDTASCPSGWLPYHDADGRMLVGATPAKAYRTAGGTETIRLTEEQLPPHHFELRFTPDRENLQNGGYDLVRSVLDFSNTGAPGTATAKTSTVGRGDPISFMPPYRALYFCIRK